MSDVLSGLQNPSEVQLDLRVDKLSLHLVNFSRTKQELREHRATRSLPMSMPANTHLMSYWNVLYHVLFGPSLFRSDCCGGFSLLRQCLVVVPCMPSSFVGWSHHEMLRISYQFLTSSHWFPLVGCDVPVGLNDGSMKPSLAYV